MAIQKQKYENFTVLNCDWEKEEDLVFVLIPLREEFNDLFENGIKSVVEDLGLCCEKADTIIHTDVNLNRICENIIRSKCLIADLTGGNPNVFYEVGLAHALDKKVILIAQNRNDVPFDLRGTRNIEYKDAINLKSQLRNMLISLLDLPRIPEISEIEEKITKNSVEIYIASSDIFAHGWGKQINDPNAREGIAWTIDEIPDSMRRIIWGPYRALPERGEYIAYFKLKIDDNSSENDVCEIDVWSNSTPSIGEKCRKGIKGKDFDQPDEYKFFEIEFKYADELDMEYRLTLLRKSRITIDYIAILNKGFLIPEDELFVTYAYKGILWRDPDKSGRINYLHQLRNNAISKDQMLTALFKSDEYVNKTKTSEIDGTDEGYIKGLYNRLLARGGEINEVRDWVRLLEKGELSRIQVFNKFYNSFEFNQKHQKM